MKNFLLLVLARSFLLPTPSQSDTNHFGAGGVFEFDLGDSEIPLTPKQEKEQKLLEEQLKKKEKKKQQHTTSNKSNHNTLNWVEKELRDVVAFGRGINMT